VAQQLELPLIGPEPPSEATRIPRARRVFVNRSLKLGAVDWIGFDMDYTLAIYRQEEMDRLSVAATAKKLLTRGYPELVTSIQVPVDFPIRGLLIDKKLGHVLKMDRFKVVQKAYHGLKPLTKEEIRTLYQGKRVRPSSARYHWIDTLYALSEAALFTGIVDALESRGDTVDYGKLFGDIRECIDEAHRDGSIIDVVQADLPRFVDRDPLLAPTLHKLRSAGKRLFLLTNSRWPFTEAMMTYLLGGAMPEYPSFRHFFDAIVVAANKPSFFQEGRPLMIRDGAELRPATFPLERGAIHEGGNLHDLERALGTTGDRVLYVGDHIFGDMLRSRRESAWRTAMIVQELETEVAAHETCREMHRKAAELEARREDLEDQLRFWQSRFKEIARRLDGGRDNGNALSAVEVARLEAERGRVKRSVERVRGQLRLVDAEARAIEASIDVHFHPYWGSLLKEANDRSSFGDQVEEYSCLYTSRVSNLMSYSPLQHFRSAHDRMAHEL
jgi:5'-nucleotidase